jgi:microcystin-dependent protein
MAEPYVGEIRLFSGNYAPAGWALCDGSLVAISDNETLYSLLGTIYGGDGQTTFGLPDLRGRVPIHQLPGTYTVGQMGGTESVTLTSQNLPTHSHSANTHAGNGTGSDPTARFWAGNNDLRLYSDAAPDTTFAPNAIGVAGGNQPHENMMPFVTVSYIIALTGVYPSFNN